MTTSSKRSKEMTAFLRWLRAHGACGQKVGCKKGMDLVRAHPTPEAWWAASTRGDDMLWLLGRVAVRLQDVVLAACACARLALPHVKAGDPRPLRAIETAERWARGERGVSLADVRAAVAAAADAYADAAYAAAYAADAAAYTAAYAAADAAYAAAYAAVAAAADATYAAVAAAAAADAWQQRRAEVLAQCADLVRERIQWSVVEAAMKERRGR